MPDADDLLAVYLAPKGQAPGIGPERGPRVPPANGIAEYASPHGSYRYVRYQDGVPVAVLQVVWRPGRQASVANVYTAPSHRRNGLASELLARARRDFGTVAHASDVYISEMGKAWRSRVG